MSDDLTLLSTRYLLGELSEAEVAAFEARLATEQQVREALGDSALLLEALETGHSHPETIGGTAPLRFADTSRQHGRKLWRLPASVGLIAVASLLLMVSLQMRGPVVPRGVPQGESAGFDDHEVVAVWTDLAQVDDLDEPDGGRELRSELADAGDDEMNEVDDFPDWLMVAVLEQDPADLPGTPDGNSSLKDAL